LLQINTVPSKDRTNFFWTNGNRAARQSWETDKYDMSTQCCKT